MKKSLLLAAAALVAASASAQVFPAATELDGTDVTPAGFKFNTYDKEFVGFTCVNVLNWNMTVNWIRDNYVAKDLSVGDGLITTSGPTFNNNQENIDALNNGSAIVDFGGTLGKVLCINYAGSTFPAKYKELTGKDLTIGEAPADYTLAFWTFDPQTMLPYAGLAQNMPLRVRIECSIYGNTQAAADGVWKAYVNDDQNNVRPSGMADNEAPDILVSPNEFAYRWCEMDETTPNDDSVWEDGENGTDGEWNPNRWLVYEWDIDLQAPETEDEPWNATPRIKMEIPNPAGATLLFRNIQIVAPNDTERERVYAKRLRTWNTYTLESAGVNSVLADAADFTYSVSGNYVVFSAPAAVYNMAGAKVAEGTTANLAKGVYVAQSAGKAVKFVVK